MCTILIWKGEHSRWPLVVAANRDEDDRRASSGPRVLIEDPLVVGGRDEVAGGTWLAVRPDGMLVALANRRGAGSHDSKRVSRGQLVLELAASATFDDARAFVSTIDPQRYNPFNLLVATARDALVVSSGNDGLRASALSPGRHAITNRDLDSSETGVAARARSIVERTDIAGINDADRLAAHLHEVLKDHDSSGSGLCVHRSEHNYGTRSSFIVLIGAAADDHRLYYVEGHPCEGTRTDVTYLLGLPSAQRVQL